MEKNMYGSLAEYYDMLNSGIDYRAWGDFIEECFKRFDMPAGKLVLDLACGTGSMTLELARRGYDMTGIDLSPEMLNVARARATTEAPGCDILWLCQDITLFELYGTVDAAVCCLDSLNHVTSPKKLEQVFSLTHNYLSPGGLLVFDVNSKYKFENIYADNSYILEDDGVLCAWQNYYNKRTHLCDFCVTVFREREDGRYSRHDEFQRERYYAASSLRRMLEGAGFECLGEYGSFAFDRVRETDERIYMVARAIK